MVDILGTPVNYNRSTYSPETDPNVQQFLTALAKKESGGQKDPYTAVSEYATKTGEHAYGKYQILGSNIPSWTKEYLGKSMTIQQFTADPAAQDELMSKRAQQLYAQYGNWGDVASVHFSGRPLKQAGNAADSSGETVPAYVKTILGFLGGGTASAATMGSTGQPMTPTLSEAQLKQNIDALKAGGQSDQQIQAYVNNYSKAADGSYTLSSTGSSQPAPAVPAQGGNPAPAVASQPLQFNSNGQATNGPTPPGQQPTPTQGAGGAVVGAIKSGAQSVGGMFKDDFTSLGNLFAGMGSMYTQSAMTGKVPQYPGGSQQAWSDLGGGVGAISDMATVAGMAVGDEGAPAEETAARTGIKAALQKTTGKFASGKGIGAVAQGVSSGVQTFSKAKSQGKGNVVAGAEAVGSGLATTAAYAGMNKFGPAVYNSFLGLVSRMKIAPFVSGMLDKVTTNLTTAASMAGRGEAADYARSSLNAAASGLVKANSTVFHAMAANMKAPTNKEIDSMVGKLGASVTSGGNAAVERVFGQAKTALEPFAAKVGDISKIVGGVVQSDAGGVIARGSEAYAQARKSMMTDGEMTMEQALQATVAGMKKSDTVPVSDLLDVINAPSKSVKDSQIKSAVWDAIRTSVGDSKEGLAALDQYAHAQSTRAAQSFNSGLMDSIRQATANPEGLIGQGAGRASQTTWQGLVSSVWDKLNVPSDVDQLKAALGSNHDLKNFTQMLSKKILYDGMTAYQKVAGTARYATPQIAKAASDVFQSTIEKYTTKLATLPSLMDPENIHFLEDMAHGIPDLETVAQNAGIDVSKLTDEAGQPLLKTIQGASNLAPEELETVAKSPIGKLLATGTADLRQLPTALLKSSPEAIAALRKAMPKDQWAVMGATTLGGIMKTVSGLWGTTDKETIEKTLDTIASKAGGDRDVFDAIFGEGDGKKIMDSLINYGNALKEAGTFSGKIKRSLSNAAQSAAFALIHHYYIATVLASKAFGDLATDDSSEFLSSLATKTDFTAAYRAAAESQGGIKGFLAKVSNSLNSVLAPLIKYEVGNKLPQGIIQGAADDLSGGSSTNPSNTPDDGSVDSSGATTQ